LDILESDFVFVLGIGTFLGLGAKGFFVTVGILRENWLANLKTFSIKQWFFYPPFFFFLLSDTSEFP
jgi:hypothetical protein